MGENSLGSPSYLSRSRRDVSERHLHAIGGARVRDVLERQRQKRRALIARDMSSRLRERKTRIYTRNEGGKKGGGGLL